MNKLYVSLILMILTGCDSQIDLSLVDESQEQSDDVAQDDSQDVDAASVDNSVSNSAVAGDCDEYDSVPRGTGTASDPYILCSQDHLALLSATQYRSSGVYSALGADLVLTGTWTPVGQFWGVLDGRNHVIEGLKITAVQGALFTNIVGTVKNLTILNGQSKGAMIAYSSNAGSLVQNVHLDGGSVTSVSSHAAGLVSDHRGVIEDCTSTADVHAGGTGNYAGGLVSIAHNNAYIIRSNALGQVTGGSGATLARIVASLWEGENLTECETHMATPINEMAATSLVVSGAVVGCD